jgi:hypothetical protein
MSTKDYQSQQTNSLENIFSQIDSGQIILPDFQRDFEWDIERTLDLFDSLVRDIFIGSIIFGLPSFEISYRAIDTRPRKGKGKNKALTVNLLTEEMIRKASNKPYHLLLDGQQRMSSLYRAIACKDVDNVWFVCKKYTDFDNLKNMSLEDVLERFDVKEDSESFSIKLSDVYEWSQECYGDEEIREKFVEPLKFEFPLDSLDSKKKLNSWRLISEKIKQLFKAEKLVSFYLLDMDTEKFTLFFERSNSKGMQLSFIDILRAKLYTNFNLNEKVKEFEQRNPDFEKIFNQELVVRAIALFSKDDPNESDIGKAQILKRLNAEIFNKHWEKVCTLYVQVYNFLLDKKLILNKKCVSYENMIIPLMYVIDICGGVQNITPKIYKFIEYWYWSAIFSNKYTGASNAEIIEDCRQLKELCLNDHLDQGYLNKLTKNNYTKPVDILDIRYKGGGINRKPAVYVGILNLIYNKNGSLMHFNGATTSGSDNSLNDHHIFPSKYVTDRYNKESDEVNYVDCIANKILINEIHNKKISYKNPAKYFNEIANTEDSIAELKNTFKGNLIDEKILVDDSNFLDFINIRSEKILDLIISKCGKENYEKISNEYQKQKM